jgi:hypothetical protein
MFAIVLQCACAASRHSERISTVSSVCSGIRPVWLAEINSEDEDNRSESEVVSRGSSKEVGSARI